MQRWVSAGPWLVGGYIAGQGCRDNNGASEQCVHGHCSDAQVPFMRPESISQDTSPHIDAVRHAVQMLASEDPPCRPKWICLLQPTSPFNTSEDIDAAVELAFQKDCGSVIRP